MKSLKSMVAACFSVPALRKLILLLLLSLIVLTTLGWPRHAMAASCGEDAQKPCLVERVRAPCYSMGPGCWYIDKVCANATSHISSDGLCAQNDQPSGVTCCEQVAYEDSGHLVSQGYMASIDLTKAWVVIPNLDIPTTCGHNSALRNPVESVVPNRKGGFATWNDDSAYQTRLKINANFYEVEDLHPYYNPCSKALGLVVSNTVIVAQPGQVHGSDTQSLVFFTPEAARAVGHQAAIVADALQRYPGKIQNAVSGFQLIANGQYIQQPASIDPTSPRPRTVVGLSADRNTLFVVVVNPGRDGGPDSGGATLLPDGIVKYLLTLGVEDALTLDGSGSAQLYYLESNGGTIETLPSDELNEPGLFYRPVTTFLGFR